MEYSCLPFRIELCTEPLWWFYHLNVHPHRSPAKNDQERKWEALSVKTNYQCFPSLSTPSLSWMRAYHSPAGKSIDSKAQTKQKEEYWSIQSHSASTNFPLLPFGRLLLLPISPICLSLPLSPHILPLAPLHFRSLRPDFDLNMRD